MTEQQTDRERRAMWRQIATDAGDDPYVNTLHPDEVLALLDRLDQAEAELDSWMARAYEAEGKLWKAEARIKAVEDALDVDEHVTKQMGTLGQWRPDVPAIAHDTIRRALDGA